MWKDIIIGEGNSGNSAIIIFSIKGNEHISENSVSYWISDCILGMGITIFKNTAEGKIISYMINNKDSLETINDYIDSIILKNIDVDVLKEKILKTQKEYFKKGMERKTRIIRKVLDIE